MRQSPRSFSLGEVEKLKRLRAAGWTLPALSRLFHRSQGTLSHKLHQEQRAALQGPKVLPSEIPNSVLEDRARRLEASHRDLTGFVFGDPVVGQSMLDRRPA